MLSGFELLNDNVRTPLRAQRFMAAMAEVAPAGTVGTTSYLGRHRGLMLYGPGALHRLPIIERHRQAGGVVATWDLGYWDRDNSMRLAVNTLHPTATQLAMAPEGPGRREYELREDADPAGPVMLVGLGPKSVLAYDVGGSMAWETKKLRELQRRFPGREIRWRPKGHHPTPLEGTTTVHGNSIEDALRGCSLVACRHSNVAVDAAVAGVPVECEDGAAFALYRDNPTPTREQRAEFLRRLSFWEWSRFHGEQAWSWVRRVTGV